MRKRWCLLIAAVASIAVAAPAGARDGVDVDVIARGLDNPRHVAVSKDGDVYVAESGRGGNHATARSCFDSAEGFACTGRTGAVTKIGGWGQFRVVRGLASFAPANGNNAIGPHGVYVDGHDLYVTNGGPTAPTRGNPPVLVLRDPTLVAEDRISTLYGKLLRIKWPGRFEVVADAWKFERDVNPDRDVGNPIVDSNPVDVLIDGGRAVMADAGGNSIIRTTGHRGRLEALTVFPNVPTPSPVGTIPMQAVPTGVVKGPDGFYYVSQLTGFPFPIGGAKVFRVNPWTGAYTTYATGFTNIIDLDFGRDGTLYVLELDSDSIIPPEGARDGGLWAVSRKGGAPRKLALPAGTLIEPGGIAVGDRGRLYVSNHSREAGVGEVLSIDLGDGRGHDDDKWSGRHRGRSHHDGDRSRGHDGGRHREGEDRD